MISSVLPVTFPRGKLLFPRAFQSPCPHQLVSMAIAAARSQKAKGSGSSTPGTVLVPPCMCWWWGRWPTHVLQQPRCWPRLSTAGGLLWAQQQPLPTSWLTARSASRLGRENKVEDMLLESLVITAGGWNTRNRLIVTRTRLKKIA